METQEKEAETPEAKPGFPEPVLSRDQWQEVRRAVEAGLEMREAAERFKLSYQTLKVRAWREGWLHDSKIKALAEQVRQKEAAKVENLKPGETKGQNCVVSASEALATSLESHRSQTLLGLAKTLKNAINSPEAQSIIPENVSELVQLGGLALKLYGIEQSNSVQVNIVTDGSADFGGDEFPVIDVND